jgi:hypothetical protein
MKQQMIAMQHMLPHVQPEGIYICEDLATSWVSGMFGGVRHGHVTGNPQFLRSTMVGLVHQTLDWLMAPSISTTQLLSGDELDNVPDDLFSRDSGMYHPWWKTVPAQVKHIHYYNQIVVYEKGVTYRPATWKTAGAAIPYQDSGTHPKVQWGGIIKKLDSISGESLL